MHRRTDGHVNHISARLVMIQQGAQTWECIFR